MIFGELNREVGSRYATFRYASIHIVDSRISCVLYFVLLKTNETYEDDSFKKGARVTLPYMASDSEDKAILNHIKHFSNLRNMEVLAKYAMTYLVKDIFEKESGEISDNDPWKTKEKGLKNHMSLPFKETDIVKEFVFFDDWFIHDENKSEIRTLEKEINISLTTVFFDRFFESLNPVRDSWNSKGRVLLSDLKKLALNTDLLTYHPGLMPALGHIRDINVYDNDATFVLRIREGVDAHEPQQYIIENYHGKITRYLAYHVISKNYVLRRLYHEINGKSIDKLESGVMASCSAGQLQLDILMYLSESGAKVDMSGFSDMDFPDNGPCSLTHAKLENFRKTGYLLSIELTDENIKAIKRHQASRSIMGRPVTITGVTTAINGDWLINKIAITELRFQE